MISMIVLAIRDWPSTTDSPIALFIPCKGIQLEGLVDRAVLKARGVRCSCERRAPRVPDESRIRRK
jgi:hypothetical protein